MTKEDCKWYIEHGDIETMKSLLILGGPDMFNGTLEEYNNYLNTEVEK